MRIATIVFYLCFLTVATFHNCFCNGNSNIVCSKTEKQALLKFKQDLKDPSNRLSSWAGDNCCQWSGVVCDNFTGHVHEIHLPFNYSDVDCHYNGNVSEYEACWRYHLLGGKINPSLLDLKHLRYLDLSQNYFGGIRIPSFIGSIGSLRYLNLSNAGFSEAIPHQLGNLTMIRYLDLSWNRIPWFIGSNAGISGAIPHQLGNLTMMRYLDLSGNYFGGIRIPSFIGSIGSLSSVIQSQIRSVRKVSTIIYQVFDRDWKKIEDFVGSKTQTRSRAQNTFEGPKNDTIAHVPPPRKEPKNGLACDDNESTYGRGFCLNFGHSDMLFLLKIGSFSTITSFHGYPSLLNSVTPGYSPWDDTSMLIHSPSGGIMLSQDEYNLHGFLQTKEIQVSQENPSNIPDMEKQFLGNQHQHSVLEKLNTKCTKGSQPECQVRVQFAELLKSIIPQVDNERATQLHKLFFRLRDIVGCQLLTKAVKKVQIQYNVDEGSCIYLIVVNTSSVSSRRDLLSARGSNWDDEWHSG
ncbi:unnamed protein product [Camellia sinensis]